MSYIRSQRIHIRHLRKRLLVFIALCGLAWLVLIVRLWQLQIGQQQHFSDLSLNNRIRLVRLKAPRGLIRDRNKTLLVSNRPAFHAALILEDAGTHLEKSLARLSELLGVPVDSFREIIDKTKPGLPPFRPLILRRHLTNKEVALLEERQLDMPGITVMTEPVRNYHFGSLASHTLGYLGEITEAQLKQPQYRNVRQGDYVGQYGLERIFNSHLTGEDGGKQVEVNAEGRELEILGRRDPLPGRDLFLTLDVRLQLKAEELIKGKTGAIVALDPNNGDVLAMVSSPGFDPNLMATGITQKQWVEILNHPDKPLHNRVIQSSYPPGSVFKTVVMAAAMDQDIADVDTTGICLGSFHLGKWSYDCWRKGGHGEIGFIQALERSCNVFFYRLGHQLGVDTIAHYAFAFGLGKPTGIDLINEKRGLVPTSQWKKKTHRAIWLPGETVSLSIGQGYLGVTPLQLAGLISVAANKGTLYRPRLVKKISNPAAGGEHLFYPETLSKIKLREDHWSVLREALRSVVEGERGTGKRARIKGVHVGGKTGTAQVVAKRPEFEDMEEDEVPEEFRDHAWFVAFAPAGKNDKPLIAVSVLVEHGGHGGSACAPLAREIIEEYLRSNFPHLLERKQPVPKAVKATPAPAVRSTPLTSQ